MLFRQTYTYYILNKKRVPANTPGAKRVVRESRTWYADVPGAGGKKRVALGPNKQAAMRKLTELLERGKLPSHERHAEDTLAEAIEEFVRHLRSGAGGKRGRSPGANYLRQVGQILRDVLVRDCRFACLRDLAGGPVRHLLAERSRAIDWPPPLPTPSDPAGYRSDEIGRWLGIKPGSVTYTARRLGLVPGGTKFRPRYSAEQAVEIGRVSRAKRPPTLSTESRWHYTRILRAFSAWLHAGGRIASDVLADLPLPPRDQVEAHARRALSLEEIGRLLETTGGSTRTVQRLSGRDRRMLYLLALSTGFRASELTSLTPAHFRLDDATPHILLPGSRDKRGDTARQPLPPAIVAELRDWLQGREPAAVLWRGLPNDRTAKLLRADLRDAGIVYRLSTPEGNLFADFHALRHTFIASLDRAGLTLKQAMQLARHSTPTLTARVYGRASLAELGAAVSRVEIPKPNASEDGE